MLLHPMIVHFPIALLLSAVALDVFGFLLKRPPLTQAGFYLLCLGCIGAIAAYLSGQLAKRSVALTPGARTLVGLHESAALAVVGLSGLLILIRFWNVRGLQGAAVSLYFAGAVLLVAAVSITGWYGGEVVYHHGAGVQTAQALIQSEAGSAPEQSRLGGEPRARPPDPTGHAVVNGLWAAIIAFLVLTGGTLLLRWRALFSRIGGLPCELWHYLQDDWANLWIIRRD